MRIPSAGLSKAEVAAAVEGARGGTHWPWREGKLFAYTFEAGPASRLGHALMAYLTENGLDPTTFPSLRTFENDLVDMLRGATSAVTRRWSAISTQRRTESILLAVKTARDHARHHRPSVTRPKMLVPITAHAAFHKAGHYLGVEVVLTAVHPDTYLADVADMRAELMDAVLAGRLGLLVRARRGGPRVQIPRGAGARARRAVPRGRLHGNVLLLPYLKRLGAPVPDFDFRVPGVTSMSMDLHKYGLCPKGASIRARSRRVAAQVPGVRVLGVDRLHDD